MRVIKPTEITSTTQFSRASTATYYDEDGILQTAAIDELRLNYNPDTLESEGILIESASTNLAIRSQEFDNANWSKAKGTLTANAGIAPDGTLTMDLFIEDNTLGGHNVNQFRTGSNETTTLSAYAKAKERNKVALIMSNFSSLSMAVVFDLSLGTIISIDPSNADYTSPSATIEHVGNGIYRCSLTVTKGSVNTNNCMQINLVNNANSTFYTGDGVSGLYIWGAQLEPASTMSSYIPTAAVAVTRSADILGDMVTSSVAEPDLTTTPPEALWVAATNYALDDIVIRTTTHKKYQNIQAGVDATLPEDDAALDTPTRWIEIGSTNRYAMFDTLRNTQTITTSPLSVILTAGRRIDSIGVLAMEADSITISMVNAGVEVYSFTQNLNTRVTLGWYDYFYGEFSNIPSIVKFDLPPYTDGEVMVTITSTTGMVACGAVVIGNQTYLGEIQYNAVSEEQNFSRIEREFDGTAVLLQRRSIPKINAQLFAEKPLTNRIRAARTELNAVPTVWSGLDDASTDDYFDALLILGIYKRFEIDVAHPNQTLINLELEEI
jgi:hypothetical protein